MKNGPVQLSLEASLVGDDFALLAARCMEIQSATAKLPPLRGWRREGSKLRKGLPIEAATLPGPDGPVLLVHEDPDDYGAVSAASGDKPAWLALEYPTSKRDHDAACRLLEGLADLCRELLRRDLLTEAWVCRHSGGRCVPAPPVASDAAHLVVASAEEVARDYIDPEAFWGAWDRVETFGDRRLCTRTMDAPANPAFLERVLRGQMAMARAAKPGLTRFYVPEFAEGEIEVWDAGESTLRSVGYSPSQKMFEFSGWTPSGTELRCADLYNAWDIASLGQLPDGRPVEEVRVVFTDREQAQRSGKLLQEAGVAVLWEDERGELQRLPAPPSGG